MSIAVKDFLKARRDRALGSIMGFAEREVYPSLTKTQQLALRNTVLDSLNSYHDSVLDLVKSENNTVRNEELIQMLERLDVHLTKT